MHISRRDLVLLIALAVSGYPTLASAQRGGEGGHGNGGADGGRGSPGDGGMGPSSGGGSNSPSSGRQSGAEPDKSAPPSGGAGQQTIDRQVPDAPAPFSKDQDRALEAVRDGSAVPVSDIISATRNITAGQIVDVQLFPAIDGKQLVYRVTILERTGNVKRFSFDAGSARLLGME